MKFSRTIFATLFVALANSAAFAQTTPPAAPQITTPQPSAPALLPAGKVALINTNLFQRDIAEYKEKIEQLNRQFEPRVKELQSIADRVTSLENTIKTQGNSLQPSRIAEMSEEIAKLKRDYQRKAEDLQADAERERDRALAPVNEKLSKFAIEYTAKRNIVLLIDLVNAVQSNALIWYDPRADITQDFIAEYNKANPPSAASSKPAPQKP